MCLAVPGLVIERSGDLARVDFGGNAMEISAVLTPQVGAGDWVLVHAGFAIATLKEEEALETWDYLRSAGIDGVVGVEDEAQEQQANGEDSPFPHQVSP